MYDHYADGNSIFGIIQGVKNLHRSYLDFPDRKIIK